MPTIAEQVLDRMVAVVAAGGIPHIETIARAMRKSGEILVSDAYLRSGKMQKTKVWLSKLPEANALAAQRKMKLEAIADEFALARVKDAKFSELAQASSTYRKDLQLLTGGSTDNIAIHSVEISIRK